MNNRNGLQLRTSEMQYNSDNDEMIIEGYFIRFNEPTEIAPGVFEQVLPEAVDVGISDIRALWNHDTQYVLGRTKNNTLELRVDNVGLWGRIILPQTTYAKDLHALVKRGDVNQCSFGFNILDEDMEERKDGSVLFSLRKIDLHEISVVTFPAYPTTSVSAREAEKARMERQKAKLKKILVQRRQ